MTKRSKIAALIRELRAIKTPTLTVREKNNAIRSHARALERALHRRTK